MEGVFLIHQAIASSTKNTGELIVAGLAKCILG